MSDPIRPTLERVKELDKKSTEGPWVLGANDSDGNRYILSLCHDCWPPCQYEGVRVASSVEVDSELISEYRTTAPQLARALEAVLDVCDHWEARGEHDMEYSKQVPEGISDVIYENGSEMTHRAQVIRNTIIGHLGGVL